MISGLRRRTIGGDIPLVYRASGTINSMRSVLLLLWTAAVGPAQTLWTPPKPSTVQPPKAPYTFVREDPSGTQPKLFVRDAAGATWNVKFGYEVHNESFCWRIVQQCG